MRWLYLLAALTFLGAWLLLAVASLKWAWLYLFG